MYWLAVGYIEAIAIGIVSLNLKIRKVMTGDTILKGQADKVGLKDDN